MDPLQPHLAQKYYRTDQVYTLVHFEERSRASHNHQFAWLQPAWRSLPEPWATALPSSEHLRAWALVRAGYCYSHMVNLASKAEARSYAAFLQQIHPLDVVDLNGTTVIHARAMSQKLKRDGNDGMDKEEFNQSKEAILDVIKRLLGIDDIEDLRSAQDT